MIEIIGPIVKDRIVRKYQFHEDGTVKAFLPQDTDEKVIWEETNFYVPVTD